MIEIAYLNEELIGRSPHETLARRYSELVRDLFFNGDGEEPSARIVPVGFLLYTNLHPEFRDFMSRPDSWSFLNALTRDHLYIFSVRPKRAEEPLDEADEKRMIDLAKTFSLGDVFPTPYLVLLDLRLDGHETHITGEDGKKQVYYTKIGKTIQIRIAHRKVEDYANAFRNALGRAVKGWQGADSPVTAIADIIGAASFSASFLEAAEILFKEDFAKKFAAIWVLLNWRPRKL
jgi:hypothetical protein